MDSHSVVNDDPWRRGPRTPLAWSLWLYLTHPILLVLALLAGAGRALQLGWAAESSSAVYGLLELVVEPARLLIGVAVIGAGSIRRGGHTLRRFWVRTRAGSDKPATGEASAPRSANTDTPSWERVRALSGRLLGALIAMAAFALLGNWCIDQVAETSAAHTIVRATLGATGPTATTTAQFFLKNITVIPIAIIWYGGMYRMLRPQAQSFKA